MGIKTHSALAPAAPRKRLQGTNQQVPFWDAVLDMDSGNLVLEARAGTGKTSSIVEGMHRVAEHGHRRATTYCVFNRSMADESAEKVPARVQCATIHRLANRALNASGRREVRTDKTYTILNARGFRKMARGQRGTVARIVGFMKNLNAPLGMSEREAAAMVYDLADNYGMDLTNDHADIVDAVRVVFEESAKVSGIIDYDDMLWLAYVEGVAFPRCDDLYVDEAQDLNPIQHALIPRMCPRGRIIAVGDPYQSIYAFRGADSQSMPNLIRQLDARVFPLTKSFRCPKSHARLAAKLVPDFEAADSNREGTLDDYSAGQMSENVQLGDLVICNRNAPLVSNALRLIAKGIPAVMRGRDFATDLVELVDRVGDVPTIKELIRGVQEWEGFQLDLLAEREASESAIQLVQDRAACVIAIAGRCQLPGQVRQAISDLFDDKSEAADQVTFSTVHRAKGSEAHRVHVIDTGDRPRRNAKPWEIQQARNVAYVGLTRSLDYMAFVY